MKSPNRNNFFAVLKLSGAVLIGSFFLFMNVNAAGLDTCTPTKVEMRPDGTRWVHCETARTCSVACCTSSSRVQYDGTDEELRKQFTSLATAAFLSKNEIGFDSSSEACTAGFEKADRIFLQ